MKILFVGDVFGKPGRDALLEWLPGFREERAVRLQDEYMMAGVKPIMTDPTLAERQQGAIAVVIEGIALHVLYSTDASAPIRFGRTLDQARRRVQTRHPARALVRSATRDASTDCATSLCAPAPAGDFDDLANPGTVPDGH